MYKLTDFKIGARWSEMRWVKSINDLRINVRQEGEGWVITHEDFEDVIFPGRNVAFAAADLHFQLPPGGWKICKSLWSTKDNMWILFRYNDETSSSHWKVAFSNHYALTYKKESFHTRQDAIDWINELEPMSFEKWKKKLDLK